jgi:DNA-binding response OmpR family regulator
MHQVRRCHPRRVGDRAKRAHDDGDRDKAIEAGFDDYDIKPIEFDRLIGKIERLLGLAKIQVR